MMNFTRLPVMLLLGFMALSWFSQSDNWTKTKAANLPKSKRSASANSIWLSKMKEKATEAKSFTKQKGYNHNYCFLIDMNLPSGQNRFFVYDLKKDTIRNAALVTHGRCNQYWLEGRKYGNEPGCGCTSLGKYKIGYSYTGRFGLAYKLYGLEKTNSNAFKRYVVLHAHECVPETETEDEICQSDGCPTVSQGFLEQLKPLINNSAKPVLLWIYE
jgi:hypothetical protein